MSEWNFMGYQGKDTLLRTVRQEAENFFGLASDTATWEAPTACSEWQVRDQVGHMIDVTEGYFVGFDAARGKGDAPDALGLQVMANRLNERAQAFRSLSQEDALQRLRKNFEDMMGIAEGLSEDEWSAHIVTHPYMGPLPAFFYPEFQLIDYAVHSWDIRQGLGQSDGLSGDAADMLAPLMPVVWSATAQTGPDTEPFEIGVRVSGRNAVDWRIAVGPDGCTVEAGAVDDLPTVLEFDPGTLVLTTMGRMDGGTTRGDHGPSHRFRDLFLGI